MSEADIRELTRQSRQMTEQVLHLLRHLRDRARTHVLLVAGPARPRRSRARLPEAAL